jgi:hypothetical protein
MCDLPMSCKLISSPRLLYRSWCFIQYN